MSDEFGSSGSGHGEGLPNPLDPSLKDSLDILQGKGGGGSGGSGSGGGSNTGDDENPLNRIDNNFAILTDHFVNSTTPWYSHLPKWLWTIGIILSLLKAGPELINRINDAEEKRTKAEIKAEVGDKMYYDEGNEDIALKFYQEAIDINDSEIDYSYKKSFIENMITIRKLLNLSRDFTKKDINEAKLALAKGKELSLLKPGYAEAYVLQGQAHIALGRTNPRDYSKAKDVLMKAIELDPKNDFAVMRLGVVYSELAEYEDNNASKAKYINQSIEFLKESLFINNKKVIDKLKSIVNENEYKKLVEGKLLNDLKLDKSEALFNLEDTNRYIISNLDTKIVNELSVELKERYIHKVNTSNLIRTKELLKERDSIDPENEEKLADIKNIIERIQKQITKNDERIMKMNNKSFLLLALKDEFTEYKSAKLKLEEIISRYTSSY